jgi:hypothetical protein
MCRPYSRWIHFLLDLLDLVESILPCAMARPFTFTIGFTFPLLPLEPLPFCTVFPVFMHEELVDMLVTRWVMPFH